MSYYNAAYGTIYNYYHNYYTPKASSRYDSHKKSDLKSIYNSIVNLSKEDSVFMLDRSSEIEKYSISMKESAMQFSRDITAIGGFGADKLFEQRVAYSSDPSKAEVSYLPDAVVNEQAKPIELTISSLARPQTNHGEYLKSDDIDLENGTYSFDVSTPTSNYELQLGKSDNDTNLSIQTRLARLINNAAIGLNASVTKDGNGNSALIISSATAGSSVNGEQPFSISDENTSKEKGLIDYLGIRNITEQASWANYTINGVAKSSPENHITAENIYSISLKNITDENSPPITISAKADFESLKDNIKGITGAYNQFIKSVSEYTKEQPRTSLLVDNMKRMESYYSSTMEKLGISRNSDGSLDVNDDVLSDSLRSSITQEDISSLKDFTQSALRKISHVQLNPMDYVDKRIVAYKNPHKTHFANPYITSAYSGMLFNSYM